MACGCQKNKAVQIKSTVVKSEPTVDKEDPAVKEAIEIDLPSCYECVKKHLNRAMIFFEEYHTGYSQHEKNLMNSLKVAEGKVREAFLLWQKTQGQLDMASGELLGNALNKDTMNRRHVQLANDIRNVRLQLAQDPLAVPEFDELLIRVQKLEYADI